MSMYRIVPVVVVVALLTIFTVNYAPVEAQSTPSVSGVTGSLGHGTEIVISGSNFGTKATGAAPLKYDDFQSVAMGQQIATSAAPGPAWFNNGGANQKFHPIASSTKLRPGTPFTRNMQSHWQPSGSPDPSVSSVALIDQNFVKIYLDAWLYNDTTAGGNFDGGENVKHIRVHQAEAGAPNVGFTDVGPAGNNWFCIAGDGKFADFTMHFNPMNAATMYNSWMHIQWAIDAGSGGNNTNGKVRVYVNGSLRCTSNSASLLSGIYTSWPEIYIGNYWRTGDYSGDVYAYWESLYVDRSWARVEVGDNAVYANCTHREIQIPSAWSASSITARVNRGSFSSLDDLYLFVVDESGNPSPGFQLNATSTPSKVTNVRIVP
jgi:hypothetical protein